MSAHVGAHVLVPVFGGDIGAGPGGAGGAGGAPPRGGGSVAAPVGAPVRGPVSGGDIGAEPSPRARAALGVPGARLAIVQVGGRGGRRPARHWRAGAMPRWR